MMSVSVAKTDSEIILTVLSGKRNDFGILVER